MVSLVFEAVNRRGRPVENCLENCLSAYEIREELASLCPISLASVKIYSYCHRCGPAAGWDLPTHIRPQRQGCWFLGWMRTIYCYLCATLYRDGRMVHYKV